jgi:hypothetical protein
MFKRCGQILSCCGSNNTHIQFLHKFQGRYNPSQKLLCIAKMLLFLHARNLWQLCFFSPISNLAFLWAMNVLLDCNSKQWLCTGWRHWRSLIRVAKSVLPKEMLHNARVSDVMKTTSWTYNQHVNAFLGRPV